MIKSDIDEDTDKKLDDETEKDKAGDAAIISADISVSVPRVLGDVSRLWTRELVEVIH